LKQLKEVIDRNKNILFARDKSGKSAIHIAAKEGHLEIIKFLITEDAETSKILDTVKKQ